MTRINKLIRNESGIATVLVGLSMAALMGLTALAVDLGRAYLKKSALQTAADVGALAGANSLLAEGTDAAKIRAIVTKYAARNLNDADVPDSALKDADITFLRDGVPDDLEPNQVEVSINLTADRDNPFPLFFGNVVGVPAMDIQVVARAGINPVCSSKCIKPVVVPTQFTWDDTADPDNSKFYNNGMLDSESELEIASVEIIGYSQDDIGTQMVIKPGDPSLATAPGQYNLVDLPPLNKGVPTPGAAMVNENIEGCTGSNSEAAVEPLDELQLEPGNSKGPVKAGFMALINEDPYAYWDDSTNSVEGSSFSNPLDSPRVAIIAFYDPRQPPVSGRNSIVVYQLGAFFIESVSGNGNVTARFMSTVAEDPLPGTDEYCLLYTSTMMVDSSRL